MAKGINIRAGWGKRGWGACAVGGVIGGIVTIAVYLGVPMVGALSLAAQVAGALGVIGVVLLGYDFVK